MRKNFVRLRLTQSEVDLFRDRGVVEESIVFAEDVRLLYILVADGSARTLSVTFIDNVMTVIVPAADGSQWASTDQVGLKGEQVSPVGVIEILVEKDFACLEPRSGGDDDDTFPNPAKCG